MHQNYDQGQGPENNFGKQRKLTGVFILISILLFLWNYQQIPFKVTGVRIPPTPFFPLLFLPGIICRCCNSV
jgi:hypothetical protein